MADLSNCKDLEILILNNNNIKKIIPIKNYYLKKLDLCKNEIKQIENLENLIFLEILDLGYNKIDKIQNLSKN